MKTQIYFLLFEKCAHLHRLPLTYQSRKHSYEPEMCLSPNSYIQILISSCYVTSLLWCLSSQTQHDLIFTPRPRIWSCYWCPHLRWSCLRHPDCSSIKPCSPHWSLSFSHMLYGSLLRNGPLTSSPPLSLTHFAPATLAYLLIFKHTSMTFSLPVSLAWHSNIQEIPSDILPC